MIPCAYVCLRCKTDLGSVGKMYIFVKVCLGSSYSIAVPDCNDTSSLEACNCIIRANSPVFTTFYFLLSISPLSILDKIDCNDTA